MRRVQRPSCEGFTLPFLVTVCTVKDALMLLLKGATYLETPKHDSVLKVQAIWGAQMEGCLQYIKNKRSCQAYRWAIQPLAEDQGLSSFSVNDMPIIQL